MTTRNAPRYHDSTIDDRRPTDHDARPLSWRDTMRNLLAVAAGLCVAALALLTLDVPGLILVALLGIPVALYAWRFMAFIFVHEAQIDAQLAAWQARRQARRIPQPRGYTGETIRLSSTEVAE